jgi:protein-disulfide isomerase
MKRLVIALFVSAVALSLSACQRDQSNIEKKLDDISKRLAQIEARLEAGGGAGAARAQPQPKRRGPDPSKTYSIPIEGSAIKGGKDAKVTVVKAFEFACPYCEQVRPLVGSALEEFGDDVRVAYKHYIVHPGTATIPALAACAADQQGKFAVMEPLIWEKGYKAGRNLSQDNMEKLAQEAGLDLARFKADMEGPCKTIVKRDEAQLKKIGVSGTPALFINGKMYRGPRAPEAFTAAIEQELAEVEKKLGEAGGSGAAYYETFIVEKGEKSM